MPNQRVSQQERHGGKITDGKRKPVGGGYDAEFVGYINLTLTSEQKALWVGWSQTNAIWQDLAKYVDDGINLAVKIDPRGNGALASATQRKVESPNAGLCVTARGEYADIALSRLVFILNILGTAERWTDLQPVADPDRW